MDLKTILQQRVDEWNNDKTSRDSDGAENMKGQFGWAKLADSYLPYINRIVSGKTVRFVSIKHTEMFLLSKYLSTVHFDIISTCIFVNGFHISTTEASLLTSINYKYIREESCLFSFTAGKDFIARLDDIVDYYIFLMVCDRQLQCKKITYDMKQCGFVRYCTTDLNIVPYVVKDKKKYLPLFFYGDNRKKNEIDCGVLLKGRELAYLKFCCMLMGITEDFYGNDSCVAVPLDFVIQNSLPMTYFEEEYWPDDLTYSFNHFSQTPPVILTWIKVPLDSLNVIPLTSTMEPSSSESFTNDTDQNNEFDNQKDIKIYSNTSDCHIYTPSSVLEESTTVMLRNDVSHSNIEQPKTSVVLDLGSSDEIQTQLQQLQIETKQIRKPEETNNCDYKTSHG